MLLWVVSLLVPQGVNAKEVSFPLTLDYPLLTALIRQSFFSGPDRTAVLLDEGNGCRRIVLSDPVFSEGASNLRFEIRVLIRLGAMVAGVCLAPVDWEGYLVMEQDPVVSDQWDLTFATRASQVYDRERRPAKIAGLLWDFAGTPIMDYLGKISLSLAAPVADIRSFLLPLFPSDDAARAERFLKSMRPGRPTSSPSSLRIPILAEVEEVTREKKEERALTPDEVRRLVGLWEAWDAFLVQILTALSPKVLTDQERDIFLDTLLEMRYRLVEAIEQEGHAEDRVRQEFVRAWNRLSPVFRGHLTRGSNRSLLGYLAFLAGSDALVALDALGPGVGIEISRDGLIRLARLLLQEEPVSLAYSYGLDPKLRETLGLGPGPVSSYDLEEAPDPEDLRVPSGGSEPENVGSRHDSSPWNRWADRFLRGIPSRAWAAEGTKERWSDEIKSWLPPGRNDISPYMERIRSVVESSSKEILKKAGTGDIRDDFFRTLSMAAAWQESCFRQFVVEKGAATYLRSYNGTSVGLMQINERIWRGMYSEKGLRWDIRYNAAAGCEVLWLYLTRYALKRMKGPEDRLGQAVYAMYNAGPQGLDGFLKRSQKGSFSRLDKTFHQKLEWVTQEDWRHIDRCF